MIFTQPAPTYILGLGLGSTGSAKRNCILICGSFFVNGRLDLGLNSYIHIKKGTFYFYFSFLCDIISRMSELTKQDILDMEKEIQERIALRKELSDEVIEARSHGDLSENAEYHEARRSKGKNESRIRYLKKLIRFGKVIEEDKTPGVVSYFDKVTLLFEDDDEEEVFVISTEVRIDATKRIISKVSPLGAAIFGKKIGDRVLVNVSDEVKYYVVIKDVQKASGNQTVDIPINKY